MPTIQIPTTLHQRLTDLAAKRGESADTFVQEVLEEVLKELESPRSVSLAEALSRARAQIEAEGTPLVTTWEELETEIAERRGGYYHD